MGLWTLLLAQGLFLSGTSSIPSCSDYLNRRVEGVFHYDRHSRYQLAFDDALIACKLDFGAVLASRDQLHVAYKAGLEECRAGWLISGEVAYPRIHRHLKCGENKTGIISYGVRNDLQEKWDVFCHKLDDDCSQYDKVYSLSVPSHLEIRMYNVSSPPDPIAEQWPRSTSSREQSQTTLTTTSNPDTKTLSPSPPPQLNDLNTFSAAQPFLSVNISATYSPAGADVENANAISTTFPFRERILYQQLLTETTRNSGFPNINDYASAGTGGERQSSGVGQDNGWEAKSLPSEINKMESSSISTQFKSPTKSDGLPINNTNVSEIILRNHTLRPLEFTSLVSNSQITTIYQPEATHKTEAMDGRQMSPLVTLSDETWEATSGLDSVNAFGTTVDDSTSMSMDEKISIIKDNQTRDAYLREPEKHTKISGTSQGLVDTSQSEQLGSNVAIRENTTPFLTPNTIADESSDAPTPFQIVMTIGINAGPIRENEIGLKTTELTSASSAYLRSIRPTQPTDSLVRDTTSRLADFTLPPTPHHSTFTTFSPVDEHPISSPSQELGRPRFTTEGSSRSHDSKSSAYTEKPHEAVTIPVNQIEARSSIQSFTLYETLDSCGGILQGKAGQFQSPDFPWSYQSDMDCMWVIESPVGTRVVLDFLRLALEEHRTCLYDYVLVYDGKGDGNQELGRFCGSQLLPQLRSTSNMMTVVMRSDSSVELDGFLAQFGTLKSSSESIRLVGGRNLLEGLVEVEHQGIWGGVCAKRWEQKDAQVVCHQLGYAGSAVATRRISQNSNGPVAVSSVKCKGDEATLENCDLKYSAQCGTEERAGAICKVLESCAALWSAGVLESGIYTIDPDGVGHGEDPFPVKCDMIPEMSTGVTVVGHDAEARERVSPCEDAGCYSRNITYEDASLDQLRALTAVSESCEQFVKLECRHIRFLKGQWGWWVSRDGQKVNSWGGASTDSGKCSCGEEGGCAFGLPTCNCDANDDVWRLDEGLLTDKSTLPIQEICFGDTRDVPAEMAFHSIGKLRCWGNGLKLPVLQSCAALRDAGYTDSGLYVIDPDGTGQGLPPFEVHCDMSSDPTTGITEVSHDSEHRIRVTPCEEAGCYHRELRYGAELPQLNALAKVSDSCEQYVKLDCRHSRFIQSGWGWWISWNGEKMFYWGGADPNSGGCACGMTGSCSGSDKICNCDNNDHIWRTDEGYLRDKHMLPVKAVELGDTQDPPLEMAYHTIGKLRCRGRGV